MDFLDHPHILLLYTVYNSIIYYITYNSISPACIILSIISFLKPLPCGLWDADLNEASSLSLSLCWALCWKCHFDLGKFSQNVFEICFSFSHIISQGIKSQLSFPLVAWPGGGWVWHRHRLRFAVLWWEELSRSQFLRQKMEVPVLTLFSSFLLWSESLCCPPPVNMLHPNPQCDFWRWGLWGD